MGNSKSKNKKLSYFEDDDMFDDFYDIHNAPLAKEVPETKVDFSKLPTFTLPDFLKEPKAQIKEHKKQFKKKQKFDVCEESQQVVNFIVSHCFSF